MKTLKEIYQDEIFASLKEELDLSNVHEVPCLVKVVINVGLGESAQNAKSLDEAIQHLTLMTGQKPLVTRAKKSIAGFKVREGMPIGAMVTLRGDRMYDFVSKLVNVVLPRIRDFRGLNDHGFDGRGNYNLGLKDQLIFPEIDYDMITKVRGLNITVVTSSSSDTEALSLLKKLGFPFVTKAST
ncbi:MAG: 50S ribosomal protein L5 [Vampirovibrionales bacterium]|jgi:large subunit ribosomal protein L5|nr:50S ribosomal protein L5 [Vampirovibrionales bacterium]